MENGHSLNGIPSLAPLLMSSESKMVREVSMESSMTIGTAAGGEEVYRNGLVAACTEAYQPESAHVLLGPLRLLLSLWGLHFSSRDHRFVLQCGLLPCLQRLMALSSFEKAACAWMTAAHAMVNYHRTYAERFPDSKNAWAMWSTAYVRQGLKSGSVSCRAVLLHLLMAPDAVLTKQEKHHLGLDHDLLELCSALGVADVSLLHQQAVAAVRRRQEDERKRKEKEAQEEELLQQKVEEEMTRRLAKCGSFDTTHTAPGIILAHRNLRATLRSDLTTGREEALCAYGTHIYDVDRGPGSTGNYFEVTIVLLGQRDIGIGLADRGTFPVATRMPGWETGSYGYHGDDGRKFGNNASTGEWPLFETGDVIGCGFAMDRRAIFYTRNGELLGDGFTDVTETKLCPIVGFSNRHHVVEQVEVNFGAAPFAYNGPEVVLSPQTRIFRANGELADQETAVSASIRGEVSSSSVAPPTPSVAPSTTPSSTPFLGSPAVRLSIQNAIGELIDLIGETPASNVNTRATATTAPEEERTKSSVDAVSSTGIASLFDSLSTSADLSTAENPSSANAGALGKLEATAMPTGTEDNDNVKAAVISAGDEDSTTGSGPTTQAEFEATMAIMRDQVSAAFGHLHELQSLQHYACAVQRFLLTVTCQSEASSEDVSHADDDDAHDNGAVPNGSATKAENGVARESPAQTNNNSNNMPSTLLSPPALMKGISVFGTPKFVTSEDSVLLQRSVVSTLVQELHTGAQALGAAKRAFTIRNISSSTHAQVPMNIPPALTVTASLAAMRDHNHSAVGDCSVPPLFACTEALEIESVLHDHLVTVSALLPISKTLRTELKSPVATGALFSLLLHGSVRVQKLVCRVLSAILPDMPPDDAEAAITDEWDAVLASGVSNGVTDRSESKLAWVTPQSGKESNTIGGQSSSSTSQRLRRNRRMPDSAIQVLLASVKDVLVVESLNATTDTAVPTARSGLNLPSLLAVREANFLPFGYGRVALDAADRHIALVQRLFEAPMWRELVACNLTDSLRNAIKFLKEMGDVAQMRDLRTGTPVKLSLDRRLEGVKVVIAASAACSALCGLGFIRAGAIVSCPDGAQACLLEPNIEALTAKVIFRPHKVQGLASSGANTKNGANGTSTEGVSGADDGPFKALKDIETVPLADIQPVWQAADVDLSRLSQPLLPHLVALIKHLLPWFKRHAQKKTVAGSEGNSKEKGSAKKSAPSTEGDAAAGGSAAGSGANTTDSPNTIISSDEDNTSDRSSGSGISGGTDSLDAALLRLCAVVSTALSVVLEKDPDAVADAADDAEVTADLIAASLLPTGLPYFSTLVRVYSMWGFAQARVLEQGKGPSVVQEGGKQKVGGDAGGGDALAGGGGSKEEDRASEKVVAVIRIGSTSTVIATTGAPIPTTSTPPVSATAAGVTEGASEEATGGPMTIFNESNRATRLSAARDLSELVGAPITECQHGTCASLCTIITNHLCDRKFHSLLTLLVYLPSFCVFLWTLTPLITVFLQRWSSLWMTPMRHVPVFLLVAYANVFVQYHQVVMRREMVKSNDMVCGVVVKVTLLRVMLMVVINTTVSQVMYHPPSSCLMIILCARWTPTIPPHPVLPMPRRYPTQLWPHPTWIWNVSIPTGLQQPLLPPPHVSYLPRPSGRVSSNPRKRAYRPFPRAK